MENGEVRSIQLDRWSVSDSGGKAYEPFEHQIERGERSLRVSEAITGGYQLIH